MTTLDVSQGGVEALVQVDAELEVSQAGVEVLGKVNTPIRASQAGVETLARVQPEFSISQAGVEVLCKAIPCVKREAQFWIIERLDGEEFRFTSHDRNVTFQGQVFKACASLAPSAAESAADAGSVGNQELAGILSDASISEFDLFAGRFNGAYVEAWLATWDRAIPTPTTRLLAGWMGAVEHGDNGWKCELLGQGQNLQQTPLVKTFTGQCRWLRVGVPECGVDLYPLTVEGMVEEGLGQRSFIDSQRTEEAGYFDFGRVTFTSGLNEGITCEIRSHTAGGVFELWPRLANPITAYDTYEMHPGCDQLPTTCRTKFDNFINFGGFEDIPGEDAIAESPDAKQ